MILKSRPTTPDDFPACVDVMQDGFLYQNQNDREELFRMWKALLSSGMGFSGVVEDISDVTHLREYDKPRIIGFGFAIFVTDEFLLEAMSSLQPYMSQQILRRWLERRHPILSYKEVAQRNSKNSNGVNWLGLHTGWNEASLSPENREGLRDYMLGQLLTNSSGYKLRAFMKEVYGEAEQGFFLEFGAQPINDYPTLTTPVSLAVGRPKVMGLVRTGASNPVNEGRGFHPLFVYRPPHLGLSSRQQDVLRLAMDGWADVDISEILRKSGQKITASTVKGHINRAILKAEKYPGILPLSMVGTSQRQHLVDYLRDHLEELRPHI